MGEISWPFAAGVGQALSRCDGLYRRSLASVGGTLAAARSALEHGAAGNLAGGTHHAHRDFGAGYCVFNDLAVTSRVLLEEGPDTLALSLGLN